MHQLPGHTLLLLMDGHSSHYHPGTIHKAAENKVVLFVLPLNTTHLTQPLDKGCFGPLKSKWSEVFHKYMAKNAGKVVNQLFVFSQLLHEAWIDAMTSLNSKAGFRTTGIYPLDRNAVAVKIQKPTMDTDASKNIHLLPLCRPLPLARGLESYTKLPVFNQEQLQRFERRYEAEHEPDEEYQCWIDIYHPQNTRKLPDGGITSHTHVDKVTTFIPAPANAHDQLTEEAAALTSLPKTKPKAAAHDRVLTSAKNLKIIEDQQKEKELRKGIVMGGISNFLNQYGLSIILRLLNNFGMRT